jgi:hypothetical protein
MRLLDEIIASRPVATFDLPGRGSYQMPGAGAQARDIAECPLRYILADDVLLQCTQIVNCWPDLFYPRNVALRLPADRLWIEWREPSTTVASDMSGQRCGALISCEPGGRRGTIESFWQHHDFGPERAQVSVEFDLDDTIDHKVDSRHYFALPKDGIIFPALDGHIVLHLAEPWRDFFKAATGSDRHREVVEQCFYQVVLDLPICLAFCQLLGAHVVDAARVAPGAVHGTGKPRRSALPDHVEVSMKLGNDRPRPVRGIGQSLREAPRLHLVRGHLVNRNGSLYWRSPHLRGQHSEAPPVMSRTVRVSSAQGSA